MNEVELHKYLSDMRLKGTWGDGIMLSAAARLYERPVEIISPHGRQKVDVQITSAVNPIRLGLINSNHYVSIRSQTQTRKTSHDYNKECTDVNDNIFDSEIANHSDNDNERIINNDSKDCDQKPSCSQSCYSCSSDEKAFAPRIIDIGLAAGNHNLTEQERLTLLESNWTPSYDFQWPFSERRDHGKIGRRYLGPQHFTGPYSVFAYSTEKRGIFCKPCVLFSPESVRGVKLGRLVKSPLQDFSRLTGKDGYLTSHLLNSFHEDCVAKATAFSETRLNKKEIKCNS
jgi:hypothetical protein